MRSGRGAPAEEEAAQGRAAAKVAYKCQPVAAQEAARGGMQQGPPRHAQRRRAALETPAYAMTSPCHPAYWGRGASTLVLALHKPLNMVTEDVPSNKPAYNPHSGRRQGLSVWLRELEGQYQVEHLFSIGRLDKKTTGLLLVTNCGELSYALCFPSGCPKTYEATVNHRPSEAQLAHLRDGVELAEGTARASSVRVISSTMGDRHKVVSRIEVQVMVGWNRVVRRALAKAGLPVMGLHRKAIGTLELACGEGEHVQLAAAQVEALWACAGGRELARARMKQFHS
eukprot:TRINITY_DN22379_c0_g1_i1.p1 TRINITY_DN22379_c0_g1~~TRINITY_DN22379_c0_g1_i1.p1  ORF type:complete len:284 (-),score=62.83 TRINITY_DN22379_c0_g1_i1:366-1217(-)